MADDSIVGKVEVEIRARLDALEKDLAEASARFARFDQEQQRRSAQTGQVLSAAFKGVNSQLIAMSAGLGPVGVGLSALGPSGLAAAAAIGTLKRAWEETVEAAKRTGEWAEGLKNTSEAVGMTVDELRSLSKAAQQVGVEGDKVNTWLLRFNMAATMARTQGTGPLVEALDRVDIALSQSVQNAKSNSEALTIVARATKEAGLNAADVARALSGPRGGGSAVGFLNFIAAKGGVEQLTAAMRENQQITEKEIEEFGAAELKIKTFADVAQKAWDTASAKNVGKVRLKGEEDWAAYSKAWADKMADDNFLYRWMVQQWAKFRTTETMESLLPPDFKNQLILSGKLKITEIEGSSDEETKKLRDMMLGKMEANVKETQSKAEPFKIFGYEVSPPKGSLRADIADRAKDAQTALQKAREDIAKQTPVQFDETMGGKVDVWITDTQKYTMEVAKANENIIALYQNTNKYVTALGSAATMQDRFAVQQRETDKRISEASGSSGTGLGLAALQMQLGRQLTEKEIKDNKDVIDGLQKSTAERMKNADAIKMQGQALDSYITLLGDGASAEMKMLALRMKLNEQITALAGTKIPLPGGGTATLDRKQLEEAGAANAELARQKELGVYSMRQMTMAQELEIATLGKGIAETTRYRLVQEQINKDLLNGTDNYKKNKEEIDRWAASAGNAAEAAARMKLQNDLAFERKTMFLSTEDEMIATRLRSIYGDDIPRALDSAEAAQIKFNTRIKEAMTLSSDFLNTFAQGMMRGQSLTQSLASALQSLASSLMKKGIDDMVKSMFGSMQGPLSSLFGSSKAGISTSASNITTLGTETNPMVVKMWGAASLTGAGSTASPSGIPGMPNVAGAATSGAKSLWPSVPGSSTSGSNNVYGGWDPNANYNVYKPTTSNYGAMGEDKLTGDMASSTPINTNITGVGTTGNLPPILEQSGTIPINAGPQLSDSLVNGVKKLEGFTPTAQWDYKQYSNGFGTKAAFPGETIDMETANKRLTDELSKSQASVQNFAPNLTSGQSDALTSLTFNSGTKWMGSGLGKAVQGGDMDKAASIFPQYNKAGGDFNQGLANRRETEMGWWNGNNQQSSNMGGSTMPQNFASGSGPFSQGGISAAGGQVPGFEDFNKGLTDATKGLTSMGDKVPDITSSLSTSMTSATTSLSTFTGQGLTPAISGLTNYSNTALTNAATSTAATTTSVTTMGAASITTAGEIQTLGSSAVGGAAKSGLGGLGGIAIPMSPFAEGGWIPETGPILAHQNEFVMNPASSKKYGRLLEAMNEGTIRVPPMMTGGFVGSAINNAVQSSHQMMWERQNAPTQKPQDGGGGPAVKIVNAFDAPGMLEAALNSRGGEKVMLNFVRSNQAIFRSIAR